MLQTHGGCAVRDEDVDAASGVQHASDLGYHVATRGGGSLTALYSPAGEMAAASCE